MRPTKDAPPCRLLANFLGHLQPSEEDSEDDNGGGNQAEGGIGGGNNVGHAGTVSTSGHSRTSNGQDRYNLATVPSNKRFHFTHKDET